METTLQPSSQNIRSKIAAIEAIELAAIGFVVWCFGAAVAMSKPSASFSDQIVFLFITEAILLGSWAPL